MAFIIKDRIKETTTTTGTGDISLGGAAATFETFQSYMTNGDTTYYAIAHTASGVDEWEVGIGTWNTGNTLTRTTVLAGSNGTSAVNLSSGTKDIFMTYPASKAVYTDASGNIDINGGTIDGTTVGSNVAATGKFTTLETTSNADIGGYLDLEILSDHAAYKEGRVWYDSIHKTLNFYSDINNVVHELGIEEHQRIYNNTGSTISKGAPLYFSGNYTAGTIDVPTVGLADATDVNAYNAQGLAAADIADGSYGYCIIAGQLTGVDTSGLNAGTNFFVGLTPGAVQNASPTYPNYPMCLGWVVNSDATDGVLLVNQQNHSVTSFRVRTDAHIGDDLIVGGNLQVLGTTTSVSTADVTAGAPFYRANEGDSIGAAGTTFSGSGLDDATFAGHFTGTTSTTYYIKIDGTGTPDTFAVSTDNFATTISSGNAITGDEQLIHSADNISVTFGATTGHTLNDVWTGTASPTLVDTGFFSNRNTGTSGVGYTHMGFYYDVSEDKWVLLDEYDPTPEGAINLSHSSTSFATLKAGLFEGDLQGDVTGDVTGNASTADSLSTSRNIGGVAFNGTANIDLPGVNTSGNQDTSGNAATATALSTARTIQLSGDVTGSATFDGSANINITAAVQDDSHAHVISNVDGLQAALDGKTTTSRTITAGSGLTGGGDFTANRTINVGAGSGITVNANDIAIDSSYTGFDGRYYTETEADARFATAAQGTTADAALARSGGTMTGNVSFGDNDKAIFGAGSDLQLYHTGVDSYIYNGTGNLVISNDANDKDVVIQADNGSGGLTDYLRADASSGQLKLAYYGSTKLYTTLSGVQVTGSIGVAGTVDGVDIAAFKTAYDSHNHDDRYYTETEADSRFVNVTGDTMSGNLNMGDNNVNGIGKLNFNNHEGSDYGVTGDVMFDENFYSDTEYGTAWSGSNGGGIAVYNEDGWGRILTDRNIQWHTATFDGLKVGSNSVFHDGYHPNADKWTTARTLSLSGDASGSVSWDGSADATLSVTVANNSHTHTPSNITNLIENTNFNGTYPVLFGIDHTTGRIFENSDITFNGTTNVLTINGGTAWHSSNDGSGSGLDADTVDGLQASSFLRSDTSDSMAGTLTLNSGGVDTYGRIKGHTNDNHFIVIRGSVATGTSTLTIAGDHRTTFVEHVDEADEGWYFVSKASGNYTEKARIDGVGQMYIANNKVWHAGNDGSGSGLDADLLDGQEGSYYLNYNNFTNTPSIPSAPNNATITLSAGTGLSGGGDFTTDQSSNETITFNLEAPYTYIDTATGNYGTIKVDDDRGVTWAGYAIRDDWVFMSDGANNSGIYNDTDNEWSILARRNAEVEVYHNGSVKLETTSAGIEVTGDVNSTSDIRYKKNIETIDSALEKVQALRGVTFDWDNDAFAHNEDEKKPNFTERATGVIAQDVEKVLPEAVRENEDGFKNVAYGNMVGLLIEAIKEQQKQIDELREKLNG